MEIVVRLPDRSYTIERGEAFMALIFYLPEQSWDEQFREFLRNSSPQTEYAICRRIGEFAAMLSKRFPAIKVAAIVPQSRDDFGQICLLKDFLEHISLLLVLPDEDRETIARAHRLRPRVVTQLDGDGREMKIVLKRMLERYDDAPIKFSARD